jgi:hypothetical protein
VRTTLLGGLVVAVSTAALALVGGALGLETLWPVVLGAGVGLLLGVPRPQHVVGLIAGGTVAALGAAAELLLLPDAPFSKALAVAVALVVLTLLSALGRRQVSLAVLLIGWAVMTALLAPRLAVDVTRLGDATASAVAESLLGMGLGLLSAQVAALVGRRVRAVGMDGRRDTPPGLLGLVAPLVVATVVLALLGTSPAVATSGEEEGGGSAIEGEVTRVQHRQVITLQADANGSVASGRILTQLAVSGAGMARITLADQAVNRLQSLDALRGTSVQGTSVVHDIDLRSGEATVRTVADLERELPFRLEVRYELDGVQVTPREVVGASGRLTVTHTLVNLTVEPQELRFYDGQGRERSTVRDVAVPFVGTISVPLDTRFTNVDAPAAAIVVDASGRTSVEGEWALFEPVGAPTQQFTWSADVADAIVPATTIRLIPLVIGGTPSGDARLSQLTSSSATLSAIAQDGALLAAALTALRPAVDPRVATGAVLVEQMATLIARIGADAVGGVTDISEQRALLIAQDERRAAGGGLVHPMLDHADASALFVVEVAGRGLDVGPRLPVRLTLGVLVMGIVVLLGRNVTQRVGKESAMLHAESRTTGAAG